MNRGSRLEAAGLFAQLLKECGDHAACLLNEQGYLAYEQEQSLFQLFPLIDSRKLERCLPNPQGAQGADGVLSEFIYLRPIREGALPLMKCEWDFHQDEPTCRIRVILFKFLGPSRWMAWGFRVESPESHGERLDINENGSNEEIGDDNTGDSKTDTSLSVSRHGYWHVQLIREFDKGEQKVQQLIHANDQFSWLPESDPAFPIAATDPADALLTVLVSLYGLKQVQRFCEGLNWKKESAKQRLVRLVRPSMA